MGSLPDHGLLAAPPARAAGGRARYPGGPGGKQGGPGGVQLPGGEGGGAR